MDEALCFQQKYVNCTYIYMSNNRIVIDSHPNYSRFTSCLNHIENYEACIIYDKETKDVLSWGDSSYKNDGDNCILMNNFLDKLSRIFENDKDNCGENDKFLLKSVSNLIRLALMKERERYQNQNCDPDGYHYVLIIPSEWRKKTAAKLFHSIFIQEGLIAKDDHKDRLLFYKDIECLCYYFQTKDDTSYSFERGKNNLLCKMVALKNNTALVNLYSIQTATSLFNVSDSKSLPKIVFSDPLYISHTDIVDNIRIFLQTKDELSTLDQETLKTVAEKIYSSHSLSFFPDDSVLMKPVISDTSAWDLNKTQMTFIKSIRVIDICQVISIDFLNKIKSLLPNSSAKNYGLIPVEDEYSSEICLDSNLIQWIRCILEHARLALNDKAKISKVGFYRNIIEPKIITYGAGIALTEVIQNSNSHCLPQLISSRNHKISSSIFQRSTPPNVIINIDILLNSTSITYSALDSNGTIENTYFIANECFHRLGLYYSISHVTTLRVKREFIEFAETYLLDDLGHISAKKLISKEKEIIMSHIEVILKDNFSNEYTLISINQNRYIKAFLLMYMFYVQQILYRTFPVYSDLTFTDIKVGYTITIENILLDNLIGTKEKFMELIYTSTLISKDDTSRKLRILTFEEKLLPVIQQSLKLKFPIRSNFVLVQLHESYIQLTLNQIVTSFGLEDQESIILKNIVIPIRNIYESSCLNMWENIVQNRHAINLCKIHVQDTFDIHKLFFLQTKLEFIGRLKEYLVENIFSKNSGLKDVNRTHTIKLSSLCSCDISLTENNVIDVCLKPILLQLTVTVLSSLINKNIFGTYSDISYIFNFIYFNSNLRLQNTLKHIMEGIAKDFNPKRGIDVDFLVFLSPPLQLLKPALHQKSLSYNKFQSGALQQVLNSNYSVSIRPHNIGEIQYTCKTKICDSKSISLNENTNFCFFKKGDIINETGLSKVFHIKGEEIVNAMQIKIVFSEFQTFDKLENYDTFDFFDYKDYYMREFEMYLYLGRMNVADSIPIMISVIYQHHTSTLKFLIKIVGKDDKNNADSFKEIGEPMTLDIF